MNVSDGVNAHQSGYVARDLDDDEGDGVSGVGVIAHRNADVALCIRAVNGENESEEVLLDLNLGGDGVLMLHLGGLREHNAPV